MDETSSERKVWGGDDETVRSPLEDDDGALCDEDGRRNKHVKIAGQHTAMSMSDLNDNFICIHFSLSLSSLTASFGSSYVATGMLRSTFFMLFCFVRFSHKEKKVHFRCSCKAFVDQLSKT